MILSSVFTSWCWYLSVVLWIVRLPNSTATSWFHPLRFVGLFVCWLAEEANQWFFHLHVNHVLCGFGYVDGAGDAQTNRTNWVQGIWFTSETSLFLCHYMVCLTLTTNHVQFLTCLLYLSFMITLYHPNVFCVCVCVCVCVISAYTFWSWMAGDAVW